MNSLYQIINECNPNYQNIIATVIKGESLGEKVFFSKSRLLWSSVPDGFLSKYQTNILALTESGVISIGHTRVYCEILGGTKKLVICGGGHVAIPIVKMGLMIGFEVTVLEDRPTFANHARSAGANWVICEPFAQGLTGIEGDRDTFFVIVTRGHRYDQVCLEKIIEKENAYIGMIGSKLRVEKVKELLNEHGIDMVRLEKVHTPIGLKINAETPEEIAVAIMAELIQVKNQAKRSPGYPRELMKAIIAEDPDQPKKVLATIIAKKGSAPRETGTKMLIFQDGRTVGTIGGGCVEAEIIRKALEMLSTGSSKPELYPVDLTGQTAGEEGMVCGGIIEVFLETV